MFQTVAEWDDQPLNEGDLTIVLDGHVFNRTEMLDVLRLPSAASDAAVVLAAYRRWREDCTQWLAGEFAFVIWDEGTRHLICARDHLGIRPIHWTRRGSMLLIATDLVQLLADPAVIRVPDEVFVAELLRAGHLDRDLTLVKGVSRLPGGHRLIASSNLRVDRHWFPERIEEEHGASTELWCERLRETLTEVVNSRMRASGRIGVHLSGGLDSSTVAAIAARSAREDTPPLLSLSLAEPGEPWDESRWIGIVRRHLGIDGIDVPSGAGNVFRSYEDFGDLSLGIEPIVEAELRAGGLGCRVVLTGLGGDQWLTGEPEIVIDYLWRRHPRTAMRRLVEFQRIPEFGGPWPWTLRRIARPLLGRVVPIAWRRPLHRREVPPWIDARFAQRTALSGRRAQPPVGVGFARAERLLLIESGDQALSLELTERMALLAGSERRHPLYDRRLVELMLMVPESEVWGGGETRRLHRQAIAGLVPDTIRSRRDKAGFAAPVARLVLAGDPRADIHELASRGWIVEARAAEMLHELRKSVSTGDARPPWIFPLGRIKAVARWVTSTRDP